MWLSARAARSLIPPRDRADTDAVNSVGMNKITEHSPVGVALGLTSALTVALVPALAFGQQAAGIEVVTGSVEVRW